MLPAEAAKALALVEIAGRSRPEVAAEMGLEASDVAELLHAARKALRRSIFPLAATGWCERAERLLSDRLDGSLAGTGPARLEAHLGHCERCAEHERKLTHAREGLVRSFVDTRQAVPVTAPEPATPGALLRVVPPPAAEPAIAVEQVGARPGAALASVSQGSRAWTAMYAVALVLALASVVLTVLAATGAVERIF